MSQAKWYSSGQGDCTSTRRWLREARARVRLETMRLPFIERRRYRAVWADPGRKARTLESFSQTEANGGTDISAAARRATNPELKDHLQRHAQDEIRHAEMFRTRAVALHDSGAGKGRTLGLSDRASNLSTNTAEGGFDAHGFLPGSSIDEVGDVVYIARLHVAEKEAARLFALHRDLNRGDPETAAIFESILKDEKYHVSWTGTFLDRWRKEGRAKEVKDALSDAEGSRMLGAWKRLGVRSGANFGRVVMLVFYFTLLVPFGLIARRNRQAAVWADPRGTDSADGLRSQY